MSTGAREAVPWCVQGHRTGVRGTWWYWEHQRAVPLCAAHAERVRAWLAHPESDWYRTYCRLTRMEA